MLAEAAAPKKTAVDFMHPEVGVTSADGACFGRNYFNCYSAPETEEDEFADERAEILAEAAALKKLAADYMHPEIGVEGCRRGPSRAQYQATFQVWSRRRYPENSFRNGDAKICFACYRKGNACWY